MESTKAYETSTNYAGLEEPSSKADSSLSRQLPLSQTILQAYYAQLHSLFDYIVSIPTPEPTSGNNECTLRSLLLREHDQQTYRDLLFRSRVANVSQRKIPKMVITPSSVSMSEMIDRAQGKLFANAKGKPNNVITSGYRWGDHRSEVGKAFGSRAGITNFFVNTIINALQGPEWGVLLERAGEALIFHLLTETAIFITLPNDCYCQVTGPPLLYERVPQIVAGTLHSGKGDPTSLRGEKRRHLEEENFERPAKRPKTDARQERPLEANRTRERVTVAKHKKWRNASGIFVARNTLFYRRPVRNLNGNIFLGIPMNHVLNVVLSTKWRNLKGLPDPDRSESKDNLTVARHLAKYIFPRQYGLDSVFDFKNVFADNVSREQFLRHKFFDRELDLHSRGPIKTPKRLKNVIELVEQLYHRHSRCGYRALLNKICPSKVKDVHRNTQDSSIILELVAEDTSQFLSQSGSNSLLSDLGKQSNNARMKRATNTKPKFAEFVCGHHEVFLFIRSVTKLVFPASFWGCKNNFKVILDHARLLITSRRFEKMTLHDVLQGFSISECDWLLPPGNLQLQHRPNSVESLKRRQLIEEFIFWYFDSFLLSLLQTTFYVTESSAYRNRVLYFRHDDWHILCQPILDKLRDSTFERISKDEAVNLLQHRKLGFSFVRLLPKDTGVRPIVNLRRKVGKQDFSNISEPSLSINQILQTAFQILQYEKERQSEMLGASVFGPSEVYAKLKEFKINVMDDRGIVPKLFFVKVDVQACFDTIDQAKLLQILKTLLSEDVYMLQRYGTLEANKGRLEKRYVRKALPESEHPHFLAYAKELAEMLKHTIFVDQVVYPFAFQEDVLQLLEDHITANIVKIGKDYYRQKIGIPQGSVLSSILCSFFYGDLERTVLRSFTESKNNVLLRLIDDYLFISTSQNIANEFLQTMQRGHPEYGCFISQDKTLTNFDQDFRDVSQISLSCVLPPGSDWFPWCGQLINTRNLSILTDYTRFHENYIYDSLTIERAKPGHSLRQKMVLWVKHKCHPIFIDTRLNTYATVYTNIHQTFVAAAMKMHAYIRQMREIFYLAGGKGRPDIKQLKRTKTTGAFILSIIRFVIKYTNELIRTKIRNLRVESGRSKFRIDRSAVVWLGMHAFCGVLSMKHTSYAYTGVLSALERDVRQPRLYLAHRKFGRMARDSLSRMSRDINF